MGFDPGGKAGDAVNRSKEAADHLAGVVALTKALDFGDEPLQRVFGAADGFVRIVLPLSLEAGIVLAQFLAVEVRQATTGTVPERLVGGT